jgi:transmembrane sensor
MKSDSAASTARARPSDAEAIEATAAAWLAQRDDAFTSDDAAKFAAWCAADPRHAAAVARLEGAWAALQPLRDFRPAAARHPDRDLLAQPARARVFAFPARALALAAAAALVLAAGWWTLSPAPASVYATTVGGYQRVVLTDGSVLELNGDTAAEVRFTAAERRVLLARGEAHFTVAKNPARPFLVEAQGVAVRAVGTAFNVRLGAREVEVLVTEGKVAVSDVERIDLIAHSTGAKLPSPPADTFLVAHDRALISAARDGAPVVERIAPEAMRDALAWQGSRLVFVDTPLAEVAAQFNRRNAVQLVLADPSLATLPVGGSFRAENVEAFVRLLESGSDVVAERSDAARIVLRKTK